MQFNFPPTAHRSPPQNWRYSQAWHRAPRDDASRAIRTRNKTAGGDFAREPVNFGGGISYFGASRANDSASTVSPQCSRGGPDSDTRSRRKSVNPRENPRWWSRGASTRRAAITSPQLKLAFWLGTRQKLRSLEDTRRWLKRVLQRRRFASNAEILRLSYVTYVTSGFSAYQKQTALRIQERGHRGDTARVVRFYIYLDYTWKHNKPIDNGSRRDSSWLTTFISKRDDIKKKNDREFIFLLYEEIIKWLQYFNCTKVVIDWWWKLDWKEWWSLNCLKIKCQIYFLSKKIILWDEKIL